MSRALVLLVLLLPACAMIERTPVTVEALVGDAPRAARDERKVIDDAIERLAQRAVKRGDATLDVLVLSGGGQHGAYGMGFLRGWRDRADSPMPSFDLVTGVSTGALQAPFALVGTTEALAVAADLYRRGATDSAPTPDYWSWLLRTGGVVDIARFRAAIGRAADPTMTAALSRAFADGRGLLVATTDFDLGVGRMWDLAAEGRGPRGPSRVQEIVIASCSIPGIFPPVLIDGHVHADGGVIANVAFPFGIDDITRLAGRLRAAGVAGPVRLRVWVVVNFWTHAPVAAVDPALRAGMSQRSNRIMFFSHQPETLERIDLLARAVSATVPGLEMQVRHTAVPAELAQDPAGQTLFNGDWMNKLEGLGYARARSGNPWDPPVSPYARPRGD